MRVDNWRKAVREVYLFTQEGWSNSSCYQINILANLSHRNIIQTMGVCLKWVNCFMINPNCMYIRFKLNSGGFIVMELMKDGSLKAWSLTHYFGIRDKLSYSKKFQRLYSEIDERLIISCLQDYLTSKTLQNKQLSQSNIINLAIQIGCGLRYLHNQTPRIIHRDLKPG